MNDHDDCVAQLAELAGISPSAPLAYDWLAIEASLDGLALPGDYKKIVQTFPDGKFRELVRIIRPGDVGSPRTEYLGFYANWLDDMRQWRDDGDGIFPYPIYPEQGGLLPFAEGPGGEMCFWLTSSDDPDAWPVITADRDFLQWQESPGPMCRFLTTLITGGVPNPFDPAAPIPTASAFRALSAQPAPVVAPPDAGTAAPRWGIRSPHDESGELLAVIGQTPTAAATDWVATEKQIGVALPADYRAFIDQAGVGAFCDIRILGLDPCPDFDLSTVLARETERAAAARAGIMVAFHPQQAGVIPWGVTADGWICAWRLLDQDPDTWPIAMISPQYNTIFHDELSFSSFLLKYCGHRDQTGIFFGRKPWQAGVTFAAHRHE